MFTNNLATPSRTLQFTYKSNLIGLLCFVLSIISLTKLQAQPTKQWDKTFGGKSYNTLQSIEQTNDYGYILGGSSDSNAGVDKTENARGSYDYWIVKLSSTGLKLWDKTYGGTGNDQLKTLQQTRDGGYILAGTSSSGANGDKTDDSKGGNDYWIVKLDVFGNKEWDKTFGGSSNDDLKYLRQTTDGGFVMGGTSASAASADKSENNKGGSDFWIVKLDRWGIKEWDKTIGGTKEENFYSLHQTTDLGFVLGGESNSDLGGDKTGNNKGSFDYWIVKLDPSGNKQWDKTIGGSNIDILKSIRQTKEGGYILGGESNSNASGDKTQNFYKQEEVWAYRGNYDFWIVKLDHTGNIEWDKTIGGSLYDEFQSLHQVWDGGYILGGTSESNVSGDKGQDRRGRYGNYWMVKLSNDGKKEWDKTYGGGSDDFSSFQQTLDGGFILGGSSTYPYTAFEKTKANVGITDYWIVKLSVAPTPYPIKTSGLEKFVYCAGSSLPVAFTQTAWFNPGEVFKVQLSNASGSFAAPVIIGSGTTSPITATIPAGIDPGKSYRIRVVSSSTPVKYGLDNGSDFIISSSASYQYIDIQGDFTTCSPTAVYSVYGVREFSNFEWLLPSGWTIVSGQGTNSITVASGKTEGIIAVKATNSCGARSEGSKFVQPYVIPVQPEPIIASVTTMCAGDVVTYTSPANQNGSYRSIYYNWYVPNGWTILNGNNTNTITVKAGSTAGQVSVNASSYCGVSAKRYLDVNSYGPPVPTVTNSASCGPGAVTLTATGAPASGSYRWYTSGTGGTAIPEVTGATFITPVLAATTTYYVSIVNNSCESSRVPVTATINNSSILKIKSTADTLTVGSLASFVAAGAVSYIWSPAVENRNTAGDSVRVSPTSTTVYTVTGTDVNGCTSIDSIKIVVVPKIPDAIRINAGGSAFAGSGKRLFSADQYFGGTNGTSTLASGEILNTEEDALYRTERSSTAFTYSIPVENGPVHVVLHFAEIWFGVPGRGTGGAGSRRFNVDVEGTRKLTNYDIFAKAGGSLRAIQETIPVMVTDGVLNLNFTSGAANKPKISAIEIIPLAKLPNVAPELATIGNKTGKVNQIISFTATASDINPDQVKSFSLVGAPIGANLNDSTGIFSWTPSAAGTFTFLVRVTDNGTPALSDEEQITITVQNNTLPTIRLNSGGKAVTTSLGVFSADAYLTGATEISTKVVALANTTNDALYHDYRKVTATKGNFGYSIPVPNGTYALHLHFAEVFFTAKGKRLFHVTAEGTRWLTNYDIFAAAGGANRAIIASKTITVTDGKLDVIFTSITDRASVSAIEVVPITANTRVALTSSLVTESTIKTASIIYPNPAKEMVMVQLQEPTEQISTVITDLTGAILGRDSHQVINNTLLQLPVSSLPAGIYQLQVQTPKSREVFRFIKE